jgi:hypothetical protein
LHDGRFRCWCRRPNRAYLATPRSCWTGGAGRALRHGCARRPATTRTIASATEEASAGVDAGRLLSHGCDLRVPRRYASWTARRRNPQTGRPPCAAKSGLARSWPKTSRGGSSGRSTWATAPVTRETLAASNVASGRLLPAEDGPSGPVSADEWMPLPRTVARCGDATRTSATRPESAATTRSPRSEKRERRCLGSRHMSRVIRPS